MAESPVKTDSNDDPDAQLMLRVRDDDAAAYQQLVITYQPRLQRFLVSSVGSTELAEDLVQDVFLRVWRARKGYQATARFTSWIFHIAHNVARNAIRDRSKKREAQITAWQSDSSAVINLDQLAVASTGAMPVRRFDKLERAEMIQLAVAALSERQRTALLLNKFENQSYQEIADTMGLTVQAVKSLLSRARVNLKVLLQPYLSEGRLPEVDNLP